jgi:hypothetical protein
MAEGRCSRMPFSRFLDARNLENEVVLAVRPVDADDGCERGRLLLHGDLPWVYAATRNMRSPAQRRQYGVPMVRRSLSVRCGRRHTRGLGAKLESVVRFGLEIRNPRVHVPPLFSPGKGELRKGNGHPIKGLHPACAVARPLRGLPQARAAEAPAVGPATACYPDC